MSWIPPANRPLVGLLGGSAVVLSAVDLFAGRSPLASVFVPALGVAAAISLFSLAKVWIRWSCIVIVTAFVVTIAIQVLASPYLFSDGTLGSLARYALRGELTSSDSLPLHLRPGTRVLSVRGQYLDPRGAPSRLWTPSAPGLTVRLSGDGGYATVRAATRGARFVSRSYDAHSDLASRRFTVDVSVRCHASASSCGSLALMVRPTLPYGSRPGGTPLHPGPDWTRARLDWTAPPNTQGRVLHVLITGEWAGALDVRDVAVTTNGPNGPERLAPVDFLTFRGSSSVSSRLPDIPLPRSRNWTPISLTMPTGDVGTGSDLRLLAQTGDGTLGGPVARLRDLHVSADTAGGKRLSVAPTLRASFQDRGRAQGWFEDPNFAGHSLVVIGLMGMAATQPLWGVAATALLSLVGVLSTGSRAAWLALVVGFAFFAWLRWRGRRRLLTWATLGAVAVAACVYLVAGNYLRVADLSIDGEISRPEIWSVAVQALATHPLTGIGAPTGAFGHFWMSHAGDAARVSISHAHDFWLALASAYGVWGALVAVGLSLGLTGYVLQAPKQRHIPLLAAAFVMNVFDFTLLYGWVWVPLILALGSSDGPVPQPRHRSSVGQATRPTARQLPDPSGDNLSSASTRAAPSAGSERER